MVFGSAPIPLEPDTDGVLSEPCPIGSGVSLPDSPSILSWDMPYEGFPPQSRVPPPRHHQQAGVGGSCGAPRKCARFVAPTRLNSAKATLSPKATNVWNGAESGQAPLGLIWLKADLGV